MLQTNTNHILRLWRLASVAHTLRLEGSILRLLEVTRKILLNDPGVHLELSLGELQNTSSTLHSTCAPNQTNYPLGGP